ncbi:hypothetical protein [Amycolatopsis magusensis]|uniref:hypothetical protein n=1 Tax=Amycolatopsis magusensis TaxID=882444 RepID=UPI0037BC306F
MGAVSHAPLTALASVADVKVRIDMPLSPGATGPPSDTARRRVGDGTSAGAALAEETAGHGAGHGPHRGPTNAALVLLFALQAQRIRHLTADQFTQKGDDTYLTAGRHPMLLPPRLGALLQDLASRPPTPLMIPDGPNAPRLLFPGRVPGQPIDGHSPTNLLNRHGISVRPARNGALAALASDLPVAILADLLGLHINTAVRWVTYARRDWTDYLALRAVGHSKLQRDE